jgi:membrane fusion protein, multidrug efflux system
MVNVLQSYKAVCRQSGESVISTLPPMGRRAILVPAIALLAAALAGLGQSARAQGAPPPVTVAAPLAKRIVQWDEYTGRFEAVQRVEVRPRVSGFINAINFTDGAIVKKGDVLVEIDPRPYEIAVQSAEAEVLRTQALVARSTTDYARAQALVRSATVTVRDTEQRRADLDTNRALQLSAEAAQRNAQLNLEWTKVVAPISGRISNHKVDAGNLVSGTGDPTLLTTIVTLDPIYFVFDAAEADYIKDVRLSKTGARPSSRDAPNPVELRLADETAWVHNGKMNFVDNEVSAHSGTIRGRAVFDNKDGFFIPGTFGRLRLYGGTVDVLLVPDASIVSDQAEKIVLTVGADNVVVPKQVTLAAFSHGLRAITGGLAATDKVIIGGLANPFVRPGAAVQPNEGQIKATDDESDSLPPVTK